MLICLFGLFFFTHHGPGRTYGRERSKLSRHSHLAELTAMERFVHIGTVTPLPRPR